MSTVSNRRKLQRAKFQEQKSSYALLFGLFGALILGNLTNFIGILWINDNGIYLRQIFNYLAGPLILYSMSNPIFQKMPDDKVKIKSIFLNQVFVIFIWLIVFFACGLNIDLELAKSTCLKTEVDRLNIDRCIQEKNGTFFSRVNPIKFFK